MNTKEFLSNIKGAVMVVAMLGAPILLLVLFFRFGARVSVVLMPWLVTVSIYLLAANIVILGPLTIFKKTRPWAGMGFFFSSYVFGLTCWCMGFLLTLGLWGWWAVIVGLVVMGVGVVPIGIIATLFNGMWIEAGLLLFTIILTFGLRMLGMYLAENT